MQLPPFMTVKEFCAWSRIGHTKFYELLARGEVRAIKVGRRTLVSSEAAQAWLDAQPDYRSLVRHDKAA